MAVLDPSRGKSAVNNPIILFFGTRTASWRHTYGRPTRMLHHGRRADLWYSTPRPPSIIPPPKHTDAIDMLSRGPTCAIVYTRYHEYHTDSSK